MKLLSKSLLRIPLVVVIIYLIANAGSLKCISEQQT